MAKKIKSIRFLSIHAGLILKMPGKTREPDSLALVVYFREIFGCGIPKIIDAAITTHRILRGTHDVFVVPDEFAKTNGF